MPPKSDVQTKVRLSKDILKLIDDYRFENRLGSRNQAIIDLIEKGAATVKPNGQPNGGSGPTASEEPDA